jgi:hypothetical protein
MATAVNARIERAIEREMARYGVSRSFVLAVAAAHALNVELKDDEVY